MVVATAAGTRIGEATSLVIRVAGPMAAAVGAAVGVLALLAAPGHARRCPGIGVIARWRIGPRGWARFRALDAGRQADTPHVINDVKAKAEIPKTEVEVIVGRRQILIDGSRHLLRRFGVPGPRAVGWHDPGGAAGAGSAAGASIVTLVIALALAGREGPPRPGTR